MTNTAPLRARSPRLLVKPTVVPSSLIRAWVSTPPARLRLRLRLRHCGNDEGGPSRGVPHVGKPRDRADSVAASPPHGGVGDHRLYGSLAPNCPYPSWPQSLRVRFCRWESQRCRWSNRLRSCDPRLGSSTVSFNPAPRARRSAGSNDGHGDTTPCTWGRSATR